MLIERATGKDSGQHATLTKLTVQPGRGESVLQPETGVKIRRLTDVSLTTSPLSANPAAWNGINYAGLTNGYSRLQCVCTSGDYMIAYMTTPGAYLVRMSDLSVVRIITTGDGKTKIGDKHELKWSPLSGEEHIAYYCQGSNYYRQDLVVGPSSEQLVGAWRAPFASTVDGGIGMNGLVAMSVGTGVDVMDVRTGQLLPAQIPVKSSGGVDVSPSGAWVRVGLVASANYYRVSDLRNGVVNVVLNGPPGHGGWVRGTDDLDWFVQQNANADRLQALEPGSGKVIHLGRVTEYGNGGYGVGFHVATDRYGAQPGWALVSVYQTSGAFESNVFWIELVPAREADMVTPVAEGTGPRIVRVCSMQHLYTGNYTTEGWAGIAPDGNAVLWGGNWWGADNLEVYEATGYSLPASGMGGIVTPDPTPTPLPEPEPDPEPTPAPVVQTIRITGPATITITYDSAPVVTPEPQPDPTPAPDPEPTSEPTPDPAQVIIEADACNSLYWGKDNLSGSTRGNYHTCVAIRKGSWTYTNSAGATVSSSFDQVWQASYHHTSVVLRFDLSGLVGKSIQDVRLRLNANNPAGASDGGTLPKGNERIPIRTVPFNDWTKAYLIDPAAPPIEANWNGASFLNYSEIPNSSGGVDVRPWSDQPSKLAKYGKQGDITSVYGPIEGEIGWVKGDNSYSTDLSAAVKAALEAGQTTITLMLDSDNCGNTVGFGNNSNPYNPKFVSHVALYPLTAEDANVRPALVIEIE